MSRRRQLFAAGALALLGILAFFLRDVIYQTVVVPLAYVRWLLEFYLSLLPQLFTWTLLLIGMFVIVLFNVVSIGRPGRRKERKRRNTSGQVEALAMLLARVQHGNYFKWQMANRLGRIARMFNEMSDGRGQFKAPDRAVENYLEAGLNTSFVDYPRPAYPFQHPAPTVLDLDPEEVVDYLEQQIRRAGTYPKGE